MKFVNCKFCAGKTIHMIIVMSDSYRGFACIGCGKITFVSIITNDKGWGK
jgi:PIN domain nuclease of toxin-antitoxin system